MPEELTIDGTTYYQSGEHMSYDEAVEWADKNGLRLLTRGEWCNLWDNSEAFRESTQSTKYWTASVFSINWYSAWNFNGVNGEVLNYHHNSSFAVRCVRKGE